MELFKTAFHSLPIAIQRSLGWRLRAIQFPLTRVKQKKSSVVYDSLDVSSKRDWIFGRVKEIAVYAQNNNEFYREYYKKNGFDARCLKRYEDLNKIPVVNKEILRNAGEKWNSHLVKGYHGNTGGTSGKPLGFSYDREQLIKENLFIGKVWTRLGCSDRSTRLVFRGLSHLGDKGWLYHPEGDAFLINTYLPLERIKLDLLRLFVRQKIEFLHGYPSCIYQFAKFCLLAKNDDLRLAVQKNIKGMLYGSEYPAPVYRKTVNEAFNVPSISWYGHSERVVLAAEREERFVYCPFQAYGWCESIDMPDGKTHLVGTSYENRLSPFIRYDTSDGIRPVNYAGGILESFRIAEARLGEFILDASNNQISLTALIFGRHHKIFEKADFIQISQDKPGRATLHVTAADLKYSQADDLFDLKNVNVSFNIEFVAKPYKTQLGKIPLLIPTENTGDS